MYKDKYIKGHPIFGQGLRFKKDPLKFFNQISRENHGFQRFRFGYLPMVNLSHPDLIRHVLQTNNKNYHKGVEYEHLKPVLGNGLLTNEGESWFHQRRLMQPAFHKKRIAGFMERMEKVTDDTIKRIKDKPDTDIHDDMMKLTLEIVSETMFGTSVMKDADKVGNALEVALEQSYGRVQRLINMPLWLPLPAHVKYKKSINDLNTVVYSIINKRKKAAEKDEDLLDMLMHAQDEDTGEKMSAVQLRDEVMTIFLAGHETTANALSWIFYLLSKNPEEKNKLLEELKANNWSYQTKYLSMVIDEAMRLYPPAWALGRKALNDDAFDGIKIHKGDNVTIISHTVHHDPEFWDKPELFRPERFNDPKKIDKFQYFPFGGGPRFCIGSNFAMLEMQVVVTKFLQNLDLKTVRKVEPEPLITLRPRQGMPMKVAKVN